MRRAGGKALAFATVMMVPADDLHHELPLARGMLTAGLAVTAAMTLGMIATTAIADRQAGIIDDRKNRLCSAMFQKRRSPAQSVKPGFRRLLSRRRGHGSGMSPQSVERSHEAPRGTASAGRTTRRCWAKRMDKTQLKPVNLDDSPAGCRCVRSAARSLAHGIVHAPAAKPAT
jgi:hypothetical protein